MPVTVTEDSASREFTPNRSARLRYSIRGTAAASNAATALENAAPATFNSLPRQPVSVEPVFIDSDHVSRCVWAGTVRYARSRGSSPPSTGDSVFSFDTGGGTQHITQSLATIATHAAPGETAPDFGGAIGVTHDNVEGVDITIPVYNFSETHYLSDGRVDQGYKLTLFRATGKVNDADFRGLDAGECLFLGASGSQRDGEDWEITFRFAASPNVDKLSLGGLGPIAKKGWEYLWVRYEDSEDAAAHTIVKRPLAAYVEQVYQSADFSQLGIGTV